MIQSKFSKLNRKILQNRLYRNCMGTYDDNENLAMGHLALSGGK